MKYLDPSLSTWPSQEYVNKVANLFKGTVSAEARGKVGGEGDRPSEGLLERQEGKDLAGQPEDGEMASSHARIGKNDETK